MIDIFRYKKRETVEMNYLRWLCDDVGLDCEYYGDVASTLLYFKFDDSLDNDVNRTWDAIANRREFENEYDVDVDIWKEHCGLLEMMVVLARRAADIMYEDADEDMTEHYFWVMFSNLGLDKFGGNEYNHQKVIHICQILNERKYSSDGKGGLFRFKNPPGVPNEVEIWSQLNWYLTEKYFEKG